MSRPRYLFVSDLLSLCFRCVCGCTTHMGAACFSSLRFQIPRSPLVIVVVGSSLVGENDDVPHQHNPAEKRRTVAIRKCAAPQITGWTALGIVIAGNRDAHTHTYTRGSSCACPCEFFSFSRARIDSPLLFFPLVTRRTVVYFAETRLSAQQNCDSACPKSRKKSCRKNKNQKNFIDFIVVVDTNVGNRSLLQRFRLHQSVLQLINSS